MPANGYMSNGAMGARAYANRLKKAADAWNFDAVGEGRYNNRQDPNNGYGGWDPRSPAGQNWAAQQQNPAAAQAIGGVQNDPNYGGTPAPALGASPPQTIPGSGYGQNGVNMPSMNQPTPDPWGGSLYDLGMQGLGMGVQPFQTDYLDKVGNSLWSQAMRNWNDSTAQGLQNQNMAAGGFGGDRAGIAQGVMMDRLNQSVIGALAPQYNAAYENWLNRGVQTGAQALGSDLGYGNLNLGQYNAETGRQLGLGQLSNANYDSQLRGLLGLGSLDLGAYNAQTNAAQAAAAANGQTMYTNPWLSGIGGALSLAQILGLTEG